MKKKSNFIFFLFLCIVILTYIKYTTPSHIYANTGIISIHTVADLQKIGVDSSYPLDGNYLLQNDLNLSTIDWTPIGGYYGEKGRVSGSGIFSGTFDGQGHVIEGLTIQKNNALPNASHYAFIGLFGVIASDNANDYAKISNLIFTDVNIKTDFTNAFTTAGTLAGEVNGYAEISNVSVLGGSLIINPSAQSNTVGAGGLIGECRTDSSLLANGNKGIILENLYNGADITANGTDVSNLYAGGIIGRIAKSYCMKVNSCVNTGEVSYYGDEAYGIAAAEFGSSTYYSNFTNNYTLTGKGQASGGTSISESSYLSGSLLTGLSANVWTATKGYYQVPTICLNSSAAGYIYLSSLSLGFATNESSTSVKTTISLPSKAGTENVTWSSSDEVALSINGSIATANTLDIINDVVVYLTASTPSGFTRTFKVTVISDNIMQAYFTNPYASVGEPLVVAIKNSNGLSFSYTWSIDNKTINNISNSYTPTNADLESFIRVKAVASDQSITFELETYCSELPVVYINTDDGNEITSTSTAKTGTLKLQGNKDFQDSKTLYEGATTIKGRGNSTWSMAVNLGVKKPYKIKLDKKANLFGIGNGKNKHWVLLANMIDHTNIRNELIYNFARDIGMEYSPATVNVSLVLNGKYVGLYQLCEHVRIATSRINVFNWEDLAEDIANTIAMAHNLDADKLTTIMQQDFSWRMSGTVTMDSKIYTINNYYDTSTIPEFTGGFLMDMDFRNGDSYKFKSPFNSNNGIRLYYRNPEYAKTDSAMMRYAENLVNSYEDSITSYNQYAIDKNTGNYIHYSDLFDLDSLVKYWMATELSMNWDSMKNSTFLYKDLTGKVKMGPVWDYDWAFGNINMYSNTAVFLSTGWHSTCNQFCEQSYQQYQWNRYLVRDPYFTTKAYLEYREDRPSIIEEIIKTGGTLDKSETKYKTAADANDALWGFSYESYSGKAYNEKGVSISTTSQYYNDAFTSLKQYIKKRVAWFDNQFLLANEDVDFAIKNLYKSFGNTTSNSLQISDITYEDDQTYVTANVSDLRISNIMFQTNGTRLTTAPVVDGSAQITLSDDELEEGENAVNVVAVHGLDSSQNYINSLSNFKVFEKTVLREDPVPTITPYPTPTVAPTQTPTPSPVPTMAPTQTPTSLATATPSPIPTIMPTPTLAVPPEQTLVPSTTPVPTHKPTLKVSGKTKLKANKTITLKAIQTGMDNKNIKWSLNKKGKKICYLNKKSGKTVKLKAKKNKTGKAIITVKCGKLSKKVTVRIVL